MLIITDSRETNIIAPLETIFGARIIPYSIYLPLK